MPVDEVAVKQVQGGDEELVRVLLLVPGEVVRVGPDHVQQLVGREGGALATEEVLEQLRDLAHNARVLRGCLTHVPVREEVVPQLRGVDQHLHDAAHEARVAQIDQTPQPRRGVLAEAEPPSVVCQEVHLLGTRGPGDKFGAKPQLPAVLVLVLLTDRQELGVVDVVLAGGAVDVAVLQVHPQPVAAGLGVLLHTSPPAREVDAGQTGVKPRAGPGSNEIHVNLT